VVTAGAVSAALELGLHLVGKFFGEDERRRIARAMNYRAAP
jgi:transcriptional regulator GlxA family with amidase domain